MWNKAVVDGKPHPGSNAPGNDHVCRRPRMRLWQCRPERVVSVLHASRLNGPRSFFERRQGESESIPLADLQDVIRIFANEIGDIVANLLFVLIQASQRRCNLVWPRHARSVGDERHWPRRVVGKERALLGIQQESVRAGANR